MFSQASPSTSVHSFVKHVCGFYGVVKCLWIQNDERGHFFFLLLVLYVVTKIFSLAPFCKYCRWRSQGVARAALRRGSLSATHTFGISLVWLRVLVCNYSFVVSISAAVTELNSGLVVT